MTPVGHVARSLGVQTEEMAGVAPGGPGRIESVDSYNTESGDEASSK